MNWRDYEKAVFEVLRSRFPDCQVQADVMIPGRFSLIERQIDVAGSAILIGRPMLAIVDCKCYGTSVDVKDVESVIGMAADVKADIALIVTTVGFSAAAKSRASKEPNVRIHLDIVTVGEASEAGPAPAVAVMYRGQTGAVVLAPSEWLATSNIVDGKRVLPVHAMCCLHASDLTVKEAYARREIGWCFIDDNPDQTPGFLNSVLKLQDDGATTFDPDSKITYWEEALGHSPVDRLVRRIEYPKAGYVDFTFFADLGPGGAFWASVISPPHKEQEALGHLRFIANNVTLAYMPDADPSDSHKAWQTVLPWITSEGMD